MRRRHPYTWGQDHPLVIDAVLAVLIAALGLVTELGGPDDPSLRDPDAFSVGLSLVTTLPLVLRRRHPLAVFLVIFGFGLVHLMMEYPGAAPVFGLVVGVYGVAAYVSRRVATYCLIALLVLAVVGFVGARAEDDTDDSIGILAVGAVLATAWLLGDNMRVRRAYVAAVEDRAVQLEREQDAQARRAVLEERTRIARELHDVVAHSMSVMVVQAGAARRTLERDPGRAADAIGQIESTGRGALAEMRRLVGVLRHDGERRPDLDGRTGDEPGAPPEQGNRGDDRAGDQPRLGGDAGDGPALLPQPGLDQIPALVGQCRDVGLDVALRIEGSERPLPSGIELVVYRIVQEALTNTLRHAGPAHAEVELSYGATGVTVTVTDDGRGAATMAPVGGSGHGLTGMHERVALYGGRFTAGPRAGGGFRVGAEIPLPEDDEP